MKKFLIAQNDAGQRIDKFLQKAVKKLPSSLLYKYIRLKRIKVNGKRTTQDYDLQEGDIIELYINDEFFAPSTDDNDSFQSIKADLDIVYEDENIIIMDKPKGLLCHSDEGEDYHTLVNYMKAYLYRKGEYQPEIENSFVPSLCNRIDRNTQGLVLGAKNAESLRILNEKIKNREIHKTYRTIVFGTFSQKCGTIKSYMTKLTDEKRSIISDKKTANSKTAISHYKVLKEKDGLSLLEIQIETGRTHQIRAQFASKDHPLLGDLKYGTGKRNEKYGEKSQVLCAYCLEFAFKSDAGKLQYLNGKSFTATLPKNLVEF